MIEINLPEEVGEFVVEQIVYGLGSSYVLGGELLEMIRPHIRREFLAELKDRAREDGFEFFSNYTAIPAPPSDEYTDSGTWFDRLMDEEAER